MPKQRTLNLFDVIAIASQSKKYTEALIGLLEDTIDSDDFETAYSADQKEAFAYWLMNLKEMMPKSNAELREIVFK